MGLEYKSGIVRMVPGIYDPHGHPRAFDSITTHSLVSGNPYEGKAGLVAYTEAAFKSGITLLSAMPNEFRRRYDPEQPDMSEVIQWPISNPDRAEAMESRISSESRMLMTYNVGIDIKESFLEDGSINRNKVRANFAFCGVRATAAKFWVDDSTGGQNIKVDMLPEFLSMWGEFNPGKPAIIHAENGNVRRVIELIEQMPNGANMPIHIAHVSSQEELEPIIEVKAKGMRNLTCEATPHHLFATADEGAQIGGYGCMKPTLKDAKDVKFLWDNIKFIDIIASDCAPHRVSDKEAAKPAWGVTNHTVMLPLLFGAVEEGRLTIEDLYEKMVINPRKRFNMSMIDNTHTVVDLNKSYLTAQEAEAEINPGYGQNIFPKLEKLGKEFNLLGQVVDVKSGHSWLIRDRQGKLAGKLATSLTHIVTPSKSKAA